MARSRACVCRCPASRPSGSRWLRPGRRPHRTSGSPARSCGYRPPGWPRRPRRSVRPSPPSADRDHPQRAVDPDAQLIAVARIGEAIFELDGDVIVVDLEVGAPTLVAVLGQLDVVVVVDRRIAIVRVEIGGLELQLRPVVLARRPKVELTRATGFPSTQPVLREVGATLRRVEVGIVVAERGPCEPDVFGELGRRPRVPRVRYV